MTVLINYQRPFVGTFFWLLCFDMMILAAYFEGQKSEAKSKRLLEWSKLELLELVPVLCGYEKEC